MRKQSHKKDYTASLNFDPILMDYGADTRNSSDYVVHVSKNQTLTTATKTLTKTNSTPTNKICPVPRDENPRAKQGGKLTEEQPGLKRPMGGRWEDDRGAVGRALTCCTLCSLGGMVCSMYDLTRGGANPYYAINVRTQILHAYGKHIVLNDLRLFPRTGPLSFFFFFLVG